MIDRNIPRDITKYETKLMLGLTTRQVCFFAPGVVLGIITFFATKAFLGNLARIGNSCCRPAYYFWHSQTSWLADGKIHFHHYATVAHGA